MSGANGSKPRYSLSDRIIRGGELWPRSEEHTSELQSRPHLVCRLLLEKKKKRTQEPDLDKHKDIDCYRRSSLVDHFFSSAVTFDNFFFFNDEASTKIYTLSLHAALPISEASCG